MKRTFLAKIRGPPGQREQSAAPPACHRSAHNGNNFGGQVGCGESNPLWVTHRYNIKLARFYHKDTVVCIIVREGGRVATHTNFSIFDSYDMKSLLFKFCHDIFTGFKMTRL